MTDDQQEEVMPKSACFLTGQFLVTIHRVCVRLSLAWPPPHATGFLIVNLTMFNVSDFKADCSKLSSELIGRRKITVNTPHATEKSDKIIHQIIGPLLTLIGRGILPCVSPLCLTVF